MSPTPLPDVEQRGGGAQLGKQVPDLEQHRSRAAEQRVRERDIGERASHEAWVDVRRVEILEAATARRRDQRGHGIVRRRSSYMSALELGVATAIVQQRSIA